MSDPKQKELSAWETARHTRDALRHLGAAVLTLALLSVITYGFPDLESARPWVPGEPIPLSRLFDKWGEQELPGWAGAGASYSTSPRSEEEMAEQLGDTVAANLGEAAGQRDPMPSAPAPGRPMVAIDPQEHAGIEVELVDPTGRGMAPFYEALYRTARGGAGALTRVGHWGDSSIATDLITHTVRRKLQLRFGDAGHGFILLSKGYLPYRHRDIDHSASRNWMLREITRNHDPTGQYGYGGIQFRGRPGAWARFATSDDTPVGGSVSRFGIYYQKHRRGGIIRYRVDRGDWHEIATRQSETTHHVTQVPVVDGAHELEVRFGGGGQPRIYGVTLERDHAGVVYDSLGLVGARANRLLYFDEAHIEEQIRQRGLNLVVLGFGGNEASDRIQREAYERNMLRIIERMRAGREDLGCLVFAPLDQAKLNNRGRVVTMETVPRIVAAQRAAAAASGCAFYDTFAAMGGEGSMRRWYRSRPRLALGDFRHATPAGYEVIGNMFYKALMRGFAGWLEQHPNGPDDAPAAPEPEPAAPVPAAPAVPDTDASTPAAGDTGTAPP
jgi:lysophospholipase L1-like esterase